MSRRICHFDQQSLCVNNYRGEDYNKPDTYVSCEDCVDNPDNKHKLVDPEDPDKVFQSEEKMKNLEAYLGITMLISGIGLLLLGDKSGVGLIGFIGGLIGISSWEYKCDALNVEVVE